MTVKSKMRHHMAKDRHISKHCRVWRPTKVTIAAESAVNNLLVGYLPTVLLNVYQFKVFKVIHFSKEFHDNYVHLFN